jgi:hypothetical protein
MGRVQSQEQTVELRYLGFDQLKNARAFRFDVIAKGETRRQAVITVDMALFLEHHIAIQDAPTICALKLTADLERSFEGEHVLGTEDLRALVVSRAEIEAKRIEARRAGGRRHSKADAADDSPHDYLPNSH